MRDLDTVYSRIVYAVHQEDVRDVMVNGKWLMRDRQLLTVDVPALQEEAGAMAKEVDTFLIRREESVLSKLVAIGGVAQERSFEVQVKIDGVDLVALEAQLRTMDNVRFVRDSARSQYDTYFLFDDEYGSRIRYREDEIVDPETRNHRHDLPADAHHNGEGA